MTGVTFPTRSFIATVSEKVAAAVETGAGVFVLPHVESDVTHRLVGGGAHPEAPLRQDDV